MSTDEIAPPASASERAIGRGMRVLERILALGLIVAVLLNFGNVIGRYGFGRTLYWADEVQVFLVVWITYLGAAIASWRDVHLRIDVLSTRLTPRLRRLLGWLEGILVVATSGFLAWHSAVYVSRLFRVGQRSDAAGMPLWLPHTAILVGLLLIGGLAAYRLYRSRRGAVSAATTAGQRPS